MELNDVEIIYERKGEKFRLIPIGDIHIGNRGCDLKKLRRVIEWIANKENTYWIGMGDMIDAINYTDKRFDPSTVTPKYLKDLNNAVYEQISDLKDLFEPIQEKCIGLHEGNHETTIRRRYHVDVIKNLCQEWDTPYLGYSAFTRLKFVRISKGTKGHGSRATFTIYSTHGRVGGRKGGAKVNRLEDLMSWFDADIFLMAHSHKKITTTLTQLGVTGKRGNRRLIYKKKIGAVTGAFLQGYITQGGIGYTELWNYPPTDLGVVKITITPDGRDLHISA